MATQNLTLFADTDCDIRPEVAEEYGYRLISMPYTIDGKEVFPYETEKTFNPHAFYDRLRNGDIPKTAGLSPEKYISYFEPELQKGNDILYVHFSSKLSGTFNAMNIAIEILKEKYPERTIHTFDTKAITGLALVILKEIGKLYQEGKSLEEILDVAENDLVKHYALFAFVDNLKFFKASGRLTGLSATMGTILSVKPIISIDDEGRMDAIGKVLGRLPALKKIMDYMDKLGDDVKNHQILIVHSDAPELVVKIVELIHKKYGNDLDLTIEPVNPTAGIHAGPSCLGVIFHSRRRVL